MRQISMHCPHCHLLIARLQFWGDGFDLTLHCSNCHAGPRFVLGRPLESTSVHMRRLEPPEGQAEEGP